MAQAGVVLQAGACFLCACLIGDPGIFCLYDADLNHHDVCCQVPIMDGNADLLADVHFHPGALHSASRLARICEGASTQMELDRSLRPADLLLPISGFTGNRRITCRLSPSQRNDELGEDCPYWTAPPESLKIE